MPRAVAGINKKMLVWARERSGMTISHVAKAMKRDPSEIEAWESGDEAPTYPQLEDLAYRVYKRPVAIFFFPEPPAETDPEHSFRTLPDFEINELSADTRYKVRSALAMQLVLYELHDGTNPAPRKIFRDIVNGHGSSPTRVAQLARDYLQIDLRTQRSLWRSNDDALKGWRAAIEDAGIYIFKNSFKQKDVSGFCLYDVEFPIIYVNNSTAKTRQSFTILHELGHILHETSGVTKRNDSYIKTLSGDSRDVEIFCNRFAAECLLPQQVIESELRSADDNAISQVAAAYKVSRHVVLTRLVSMGLITQAQYETKAAQWTADYFESRAKDDSGGSYYANQGAYLGERFLRLAFKRYYEGRISLERLAEVLNVNVGNVAGLEQLAFQGSSDS